MSCLIVQSDKTLLLEVDHDQADACRRAIAPFAELERAPEHIHTYRLTPLGLWNARAAGHDAEQVVDALVRVLAATRCRTRCSWTSPRRWPATAGSRLSKHPAHGLVLTTTDRPVLEEILRSKKIAAAGRRADRPGHRGRAPLRARPDQADAAQAGLARRGPRRIRRRRGAPDRPARGRLGAAAVPEAGRGGLLARRLAAWSCCPAARARRWSGAGAMAQAKATTLILVTNTVSARQWKHELVKRTSLTEDEIGEYSGTRKEIRPVTIATYQVLTTRRKGVYPHLELFDSRDWGLIVYDEVHLLPAPVFKFTADLQARRRLGLTATLVREDGRESDVFSLIGPKRFDAPVEGDRGAGLHRARRLRRGPGQPHRRRAAGVRDRRDRGEVPLLRDDRDQAEGHRGAGAPSTRGEQTLVIGQYIDQLDELGEHLNAPVIKGETTQRAAREALRGVPAGRDQVLVVSKVANFSIDLPEATVAIQVSGTFGSRQEEAQRLGRVLRPEGGRPRGPLLLGGRARHRRPGLRRPPPAVPGRAGLRVPDRGRGRPADGCGRGPLTAPRAAAPSSAPGGCGRMGAGAQKAAGRYQRLSGDQLRTGNGGTVHYGVGTGPAASVPGQDGVRSGSVPASVPGQDGVRTGSGRRRSVPLALAAQEHDLRRRDREHPTARSALPSRCREWSERAPSAVPPWAVGPGESGWWSVSPPYKPTRSRYVALRA